MASNQQNTPSDAFRLAFIRRKIKELFKNLVLKAVLLTELGGRGPDAEMIVKLPYKVHAVRPVQLPNPQQQQQAGNTNAVQPYRDGSSKETALEVVDSEDELVNDLDLNQRQEQRLKGNSKFEERERERESQH